MRGYKHLIECNCILPQFRKMQNPIFHKFVVFSIEDDTGAIVPKMAQCENCNTIHKIIDICKSEIVPGKDETRSVITKSDVVQSLPKQLVELLDEYQLGIADYELARYYIENDMWGSIIVLSREQEGEGYAGKVLNFVAANKYRVDPYFDTDMV